MQADEEDRFGPIFSALVYLILSTSLGYYGWRIAAARRRAPSEGSKISFKTVRFRLLSPMCMCLSPASQKQSGYMYERPRPVWGSSQG